MSWVRIYRLFLRALPKELRSEHGRTMEALFVRELGRARRAGRLQGALAGLAGVWDVVRRGLYERTRRWATRAGARGWAYPEPSRTRGDPTRRPLRGRESPERGREGRWSIAALGDDLAHSLKSLRRAPGFTTVVLLTRALGVGANAAIFSVLDAVLYRPLPLPEARRVVNLAWDDSGYLQSGLSPERPPQELARHRQAPRRLDARRGAGRGGFPHRPLPSGLSEPRVRG
jgi:hypothetical protein